MIKKLFTLCAALVVWSAGAQTLERDSLDLAAGIHQVECNYAGFPTKVHDGNGAEYKDLKARLWREVRSGREGYDAVAELMGWFEDFHLRCASFSDAYRTRRMPDYGEGYGPENVAVKVDDATFLIRVASFAVDDEEMAWIRNAAEAYRQSGCRNLIVDIRGNGGGMDSAYAPLAELLYDHEGTTEGVELRASEEHEKCLRELAEEHDSEWFANLADAVGAAEDVGFVPMADATHTLRQEGVTELPVRAALIIDGYVASSGEQFVLEVRATSRRTTIYGADNTLGCLDYSNLRPVNLPASGITCFVPMTRSVRVKLGRSVDEGGIAPDVRITLPQPETLADNIDSWVLWVAEDLKNNR